MVSKIAMNKYITEIMEEITWRIQNWSEPEQTYLYSELSSKLTERIANLNKWAIEKE